MTTTTRDQLDTVSPARRAHRGQRSHQLLRSLSSHDVPRQGLRIGPARSAAEWDETVSSAGSAVTPFQRWSWLQGQAELQGWRFEPLVLRRGSVAVGCIPLLLRRRGPGWLSVPAPFLYAGPVVAPADLEETLEVLRTWSRRHRVLVVRLDFTPTTTPGARGPLVSAGCDISQEKTYILDLNGGVDAVRARMSRSVRKSLQIAQKAGVQITASTRDEVVELLPVLMGEAYAAHGVSAPYPPGIGRWAWEHLSATRSIMRTAHLDGRPVGLLTAVGEGTVLYGWAGGALREVRQSRVNHALHVAVFQAAAAEGYETVDTLGAVDEGVSAFKASFGARPETFAIAQQTAFRSYASVRSRLRRQDPAAAPRSGAGVPAAAEDPGR